MQFSKIWLNGNQLAQQCLKHVRLTIKKERLTNQKFYQIYPHLASPQLDIVNVGFNAASLSYIKKKITLAQSLGIKFQLHQFIENGQTNLQQQFQNFKIMMDQILPKHFEIRKFKNSDKQECFNQLSTLIQNLNQKPEVSGVLLQLPLIASISEYSKQLTNKINPLKDVDCLTMVNRAKVIEDGKPQLMPCTPSGVLKILDEHNINVSGKEVIIVGRSSLVGLPLFHLLLNRNATITLCHSQTQDLNRLTSEADIVISAVGKPNLITKLKPGGIAIDIGISRDANGKLSGDICEKAKKQALLGTPVPGGVGPLTVAMLMQNTVNLWIKQMKTKQRQKRVVSQQSTNSEEFTG